MLPKMEQSPTTSNDFATEAPTPGTPGEEEGGSVVVEEEEATDFVSGNVELSDGLDFGFEIKPLGPTETYTPFSDPMTTSTTPAASSGDTENGYDELLKAYKEVKDQNKTLRKDKKQLAARVEELEAKVRTQEITLRENAEAIDSLSFNNQRLTKRVAAMQSQNAHDPSSGTNGGSGGGSGGGGWFGGLIWSPNTAAASEIKKLKEELAVTKQDLEIKIKENVFMHVQVEDQKEEFDKKIEKLEDAMDTMKAELEAQVAAVTGSLSEQVALTTKTTQERDDYIKLLDQSKEELSQ